MMRLRTWGMFIQHLQHFLPCNWVNSIWGNALRTCTQLYPCLYLAKIISTVKISHKNGGNTTRTWRALCILHSFYFIYRVLKNWRPRRLLLPLSQHQKVIKSLRLVSLHWLTDWLPRRCCTRTRSGNNKQIPCIRNKFRIVEGSLPRRRRWHDEVDPSYLLFYIFKGWYLRTPNLPPKSTEFGAVKLRYNNHKIRTVGSVCFKGTKYERPPIDTFSP